MDNYIYKITNGVNNKAYIGYTVDPIARWEAHRHNQGSTLVFNAIKKYGLENITFEVIAEDTVDNEDSYIQEHNTMAPNGYNLTPGGNLPPNHKGKTYAQIYGVERAVEQRLKRQVTQLAAGGYGPSKHTEETKRKISKGTAGENNYMFGRKHSAETVAKMSKANKGRFSGAKNATARKFKFISPAGEVHLSHGTFKALCKELDLSHATMRSALKYNRIPNSGKAKGWTVIYDD